MPLPGLPSPCCLRTRARLPCVARAIGRARAPVAATADAMSFATTTWTLGAAAANAASRPAQPLLFANARSTTLRGTRHCARSRTGCGASCTRNLAIRVATGSASSARAAGGATRTVIAPIRAAASVLRKSAVDRMVKNEGISRFPAAPPGDIRRSLAQGYRSTRRYGISAGQWMGWECGITGITTSRSRLLGLSVAWMCDPSAMQVPV